MASCARRRMRWELVALFFCVLAISTSMSLIRSMIPMVAVTASKLETLFKRPASIFFIGLNQFQSGARADAHKFATMASPILRPLAFEDLSQDTNDPVDPVALGQARTIVDGIKCVPTGDRAEALLKVARSFKDIEGTSVKYTVGKDDLKSAYEGLSAVERESLDNIHAR